MNELGALCCESLPTLSLLSLAFSIENKMKTKNDNNANQRKRKIKLKVERVERKRANLENLDRVAMVAELLPTVVYYVAPADEWALFNM